MRREALCLGLLLAAAPARAQLNGTLDDPAKKKPFITLKGETRPGIVRGLAVSLDGVVGDSRLAGKHVQSPLPGFGFQGGFTGKGPALARTLPKIKPLAKLGPNTFMRVQGEIEGAGMADSRGSNGFVNLQARLGMGKIMKNGVYYMMTAQEDYMLYKGTYHKGNEPMQDAEFRLFGPEVGKEFHFGKDGVVYAGVVAGMGLYSGINGQLPGGQGKEGWNLFQRWEPGAGVSIEGRIGQPNTKGTVHFAATTASYPRANRSNVSVDYNLSKKLSVGAGVQQMYIEDKASDNPPGIDLLAPYAKLTYGLNR